MMSYELRMKILILYFNHHSYIITLHFFPHPLVCSRPLPVVDLFMMENRLWGEVVPAACFLSFSWWIGAVLDPPYLDDTRSAEIAQNCTPTVKMTTLSELRFAGAESDRKSYEKSCVTPEILSHSIMYTYVHLY
jgi:hypothetical protein